MSLENWYWHVFRNFWSGHCQLSASNKQTKFLSFSEFCFHKDAASSWFLWFTDAFLSSMENWTWQFVRKFVGLLSDLRCSFVCYVKVRYRRQTLKGLLPSYQTKTAVMEVEIEVTLSSTPEGHEHFSLSTLLKWEFNLLTYVRTFWK